MQIYQPAEDSYLLSKSVSEFLQTQIKNKKIKILDLGTGSGIQAQTCLNSGFKNILCSDINLEAIRLARKKGFKAVKSDLFEKIKQKFDLIIFNPPYLPEDKFDKELDTTGGKIGDEIILKFIQQSKSHLTKTGKIFLLLSSLTPRARINQLIKKQKMKIKKIAQKNIFFEKLEVICLSF